MFESKVKKEEKILLRDVVRAMWEFWTSPTGAFILAVSAMGLGYYQFYVSRPILRYDLKTVKLISSSNTNDYVVDVKGKKYKDLYLTKVYLFNMGREALSGVDVSHISRDPIRIIVPKNAGMQHYNLDNEETTEAITAKILPRGDEELVLDFDFLNPEYQYVVNILHTNQNDEIMIKGSALNVNEIKKVVSAKELKSWMLWGFGGVYLLLILRYAI